MGTAKVQWRYCKDTAKVLLRYGEGRYSKLQYLSSTLVISYQCIPLPYFRSIFSVVTIFRLVKFRIPVAYSHYVDAEYNHYHNLGWI